MGAATAGPDEDVEAFIDKVSEVSRLVEGLKAGTISPEYVDRKQQLRQDKEREEAEQLNRRSQQAAGKSAAAAAKLASGRGHGDAAATQHDGGDEEAARQAEEEARRERAMAKAKEIVANRERKLRARVRYEQHVASQQQDGSGSSAYGTDYTKWGIWCPDDEEDDLINSMPPNTPQFLAMEKDIDERHRRMVEARQIAERCRVAGNAAFKARQYSEALRCYQLGLDSERTSMTLNANAAMAALKIQCYVQTIEHCDKVLHIADFLHNNTRDPLCVKAHQRRATAYTALQQHGRAVEDLEAALALSLAVEPGAAAGHEELRKQLAKARGDLEEERKQRQIAKAVAKGSGAGVAESAPGAAGKGAGAGAKPAGDRALGLDLEKLGRVERLVGVLAPQTAPASSISDVSSNSTESTASEAAGPGAHEGRGPQLPPRKGVAAGRGGQGRAVAGVGSGASTSGRAAALAGACKELRGLLLDDDTCSVYLRECGGLQHLAVQISNPEAASTLPSAAAAGAAQQQQQHQQQHQPGSRAACIALLNDACMNEGNLRQLPLLKGVLPACVGCLGEADADLAAAAVNLLSTAATNEDVRRHVSQHLGSAEALGKLVKLLQAAAPGVQALALALLGNCMVDKPTKAAMQAVWGSPDTTAKCFTLLVLSPSSNVAEKAMVMLGNMCGDVALRQAIGTSEQLLTALLHVLCGGGGAARAGGDAAATEALQLAAAGTLFNVAVDPEGQRFLALQAQQLARVYALLDSPSAPLRARAAGIVSRVAKAPQGAAELLRLGALAKMVAQCEAAVAARAAGSPAAAAAAEALLDAGVRTLTVLTAPDDRTVAGELVAARGVGALLHVVRAGGLPEALLGNAALCLAGVARYAEHLAALREADAVAALVRVAYDGKGNAASKNAAIALARMAHDPRMLERLRELHGVEIIYQYVKP